MRTNTRRGADYGYCGCVTGELILRKIGFQPWDYERAVFVAEGVEIYTGMIVLLNARLELSGRIGGYDTPSHREQHSGRWCVPTSRVKTLTFDECAS